MAIKLKDSASDSPAVDIMDSSELVSFPNPPADQILFYGEDELQFGELRLPSGDGPHPVVVLIHGGCWLAEFDMAHIRKLAAAFAEAGIATWALEYRRVGNPGGGWPGTFDDVAKGTDCILTLAEQYALDLEHVVVAGHSAGGHLAIWLANRPAEWTPGLQPKAVLALAPAADLSYLQRLGIYDHVVDKLVGGSPEQHPERYQRVSATERLPLPVPQYIVIGRYDTEWNPVAQRYIDRARELGNAPHVIEAGESGHFEMIDPDSTTWPLVLQAAREALGLDAQA